MNGQVKVVAGLACEDLRYLDNGRPILTSIVSPVLRPVTFPTTLKLWFVGIANVLREGEAELTYRIIDGKGTVRATAEGDFKAHNVVNGSLTPFGPVDLEFDEPDTFSLEASYGADFESIMTWRVTGVPAKKSGATRAATKTRKSPAKVGRRTGSGAA